MNVMNSLRDKKKGYVNGGYGTLMLIFYVIAYAQNFNIKQLISSTNKKHNSID